MNTELAKVRRKENKIKKANGTALVVGDNLR